MPSLTNFPALDVAIGLVVMYFVLSVVCSAINETLSMMLSWRAKDLNKGLLHLLDQPQVDTLVERAGVDGKPAYIDPKVFSSTLLEMLVDAGATAETPGSPWDQALAGANQITDPAAKRRIVGWIRRADEDIAAFRKHAEEYFNATMDRVTGLYKRRVQWVMLVLAIVVTLAANADTFHVANQLWKNPELRSSVSSKAYTLSQAGQQGTGSTGSQGSGQARCDKTPQECFQKGVQQVATDVSKVKELNLPLGWSSENSPHSGPDVLSKIGGLLITIIALTMGAPFWFDQLGRLSRIRFAGVKPPTTSSTATNEPKAPPEAAA